jgi:hypothetical protein
MHYGKQIRLFLPLAGIVVGFSSLARVAPAQQPGGPGQEDRRPGGPRRDGRRPGGPNGQRPGGPGRPAGPPPGEYEANAAEKKPVATATLAPGVTRVPVVFSGGHNTDPRDGGRPVVLVAAGLGVTPEVFREAFSHVRPARAGNAPEPDQVRQNKEALLNALGKYGIDNDRIDTVSNYYRYVRSRNELWTNKQAIANALVKNGVIIGFEIVSGGAGYSSAPAISVPNLRTPPTWTKLAFGKNLTTNGSVSSITLAQAQGGSL